MIARPLVLIVVACSVAAVMALIISGQGQGDFSENLPQPSPPEDRENAAAMVAASADPVTAAVSPAAALAPAADRSLVIEETLLIRQLPENQRKAFNRVNQVLSEAGLVTLPDTQAVPHDVAVYVTEVMADIDARLVQAHASLMRAVSEHSTSARKEIRELLAQGRAVPYETVSEGASLKKQAHELFSTFTPAFSTTTFVIRPPEHLIHDVRSDWLAIREGAVRFANEDVRRLVR